MSTILSLAAVGPCPQCAPVEPTTSLLFYQAAAAAFVVLLLTGVAGEIRSLRERMAAEEAGPEQPMPRPLQLQLVGVSILLMFAMAGELISLLVLFDPPPHKAEQLAVVVLLTITVIGMPALMLLSLSEYRPREFKAFAQVLLVSLLVLLVGVGIYLISVAIQKSPKTYTYHVYGTCAAGACGLNERAAPSADSEPLGQLRDGDEVEIVCQKEGRPVTAPNGRRSKTWDKLDNGAFVSDVAVDTPPAGNEIPACDDPPSEGPHSG